MELFVRGKGVHILKEEKEVQPVFSETKSFLKLYMITMTEQERLYGLKLLEVCAFGI